MICYCGFAGPAVSERIVVYFRMSKEARVRLRSKNNACVTLTSFNHTMPQLVTTKGFAGINQRPNKP